MVAGAGIPAADMHLGRVAGAADAVPSTLTLEPAKPSVSVTVSNTSGKTGLVVGRLGDRVATAVVPSHSANVTLTWDGPAMAGDASGVLRLEMYPDGDTSKPTDVEEHAYALGGGYHQPSKSPTPRPSRSGTPSPKPSASVSESPSPSRSVSHSPSPSRGGAGELPQTGAGTSFLAVLGGGSLLFGTLMLGVAWVMRRRLLHDKLS